MSTRLRQKAAGHSGQFPSSRATRVGCRLAVLRGCRHSTHQRRSVDGHEGFLCSVRSRSTLTDVLTLTCTKRSMGMAIGGGSNGGCTRYCGRRISATWPAPHHRLLPYRLDLRYRPSAVLLPNAAGGSNAAENGRSPRGSYGLTSHKNRMPVSSRSSMPADDPLLPITAFWSSDWCTLKAAIPQCLPGTPRCLQRQQSRRGRAGPDDEPVVDVRRCVIDGTDSAPCMHALRTMIEAPSLLFVK